MGRQSDWDVPNEHFGQRVRVLADVLNKPDEIALATAVLQRNGCRVLPADEHSTASTPMTGLFIDIWLDGSRQLAVREAARRIGELAERAKLRLWVRDAALEDYPSEDRKTYYVIRATPRRSGWRKKVRAMQAWVRSIGARRLVQVLPITQEDELYAELACRDLGQPFDKSQHMLHTSADVVSAVVEQPIRRRLLLTVGLLAAVACGAVIATTSGLWRFSLLAVGVGSAVMIALNLPASANRAVRLFGGIVVSAAMAIMGVVIVTGISKLGPRGALLAVIGLPIVLGIVPAVRGSWFTRNAVWGLPLAITLLIGLIPWLGSLVSSEYLRQFDIPDSTVWTISFWKLAAAGEPLLIGAAVAVLFVGLGGWARYFYLTGNIGEFRPLIAVFMILIVLSYAITGLVVGLTSADNAASKAMAAVRDGHNPTAYFGFQGVLVCIQPRFASVPVLFGPLPTNRPVLMFAPSGERLWAWDPGSTAVRNDNVHAFSVLLQDVTIVQATGQPAHCPHTP
jgi:hypothetical protein